MCVRLGGVAIMCDYPHPACNRVVLWSKNLPKLAEEIEMCELLERREFIRLKISKEKLMASYCEAWRSEINSKSKLYNYAQIKVNYETNCHLSANTVYQRVGGL